MKIILFLLVFFYNLNLFAETKSNSESNNLIPRFVSLKSSKANLRVGPSTDYPIILQYIYPTMPLKVIQEYDKWRKIIDFENNEGWIFVNLLSNNRYGVIISLNKDFVDIYKKPNGRIFGQIGRGNVIKLNKCLNNWCKVKIDNYKGWVERKYIWGVLKNEAFD